MKPSSLIGKLVRLEQFKVIPFFDSPDGNLTENYTENGSGNYKVIDVRCFQRSVNEMWLQFEEEPGFPPRWYCHEDGITLYDDGSPIRVSDAEIGSEAISIVDQVLGKAANLLPSGAKKFFSSFGQFAKYAMFAVVAVFCFVVCKWLFKKIK